MLPKSSLRVALLAAGLLVTVGSLAAAGSSANGHRPHAVELPLLAHDTSTGVDVTLQRGHSATRPRTRRPTRRLASGTGVIITPPPPEPTQPPAGSFTTGDIGKTQYVQAIDNTYYVYSRTGTMLASESDTDFWAGLDGGPDQAGICATSPSGQAAIAYDRIANRWVVAEPAYDGTNYVQCFAVSQTDDATGSWYRYAYSVSSSLHATMPSIGVWPNGYYLAFDESSGTGSGAGALVADRSAMLTGSAAQARFFDLTGVSTDLGGMRVATMQGSNQPVSTAPGIFLQAHDDPNDTNDKLDLWSFDPGNWSGPASSASFQRIASLPVPAYTTDPSAVAALASVPAPEVTDRLPQLNGQLEYYNNGTTQTLTAAIADLGGDVGWYKLQNGGSGWSLAQSNTYVPGAGVAAGTAPSAAFDGTDVALGYGVSGSSLAYTNPTDGTVGDQIVSGDAAGAATSVSLDPVETCDFWLTGQSIASFSFSGCTPAASTVPVLTVDPTVPRLAHQGTLTTGTAGTFTSATSTSLQWKRCDSEGMNCVSISGATSTSYTPVAADSDGSSTLRLAETATNGVGSSTAVSSPTEIVMATPPSVATAPVISGTLQSGQILTTTNGTWTSAGPLSYTYRWQRCGATCSDISGATGATYTLADADVGSTIDVVVDATNSGGGASSTSTETATVAAAPAGGGSGGGTGGGGTGGGGTGGALDLSMTGSVSPASPAFGSQAIYSLQANDLTAGQLAQNVNVTVAFPSGDTYVSSYSDRGSGCTVSAAATGATCNLDFLSDQARVGDIQLVLQVNSVGTHTLTATVSAKQSESSLTNNTVSISYSNTPSTPTTTTSSATGIPSGLNGNPKTTAKTDKTPPTAHAVASTGRRGRVADLRFKIYDNSGEAKAIATVKRKGKAIGTAATGFGPVAYGSVYFVGWMVPKSVPAGKYSFCVVAYDHAKHHSTTSCAAFTVH